METQSQIFKLPGIDARDRHTTGLCKRKNSAGQAAFLVAVLFVMRLAAGQDAGLD
jgi:hypothetical protein